MKRSLAEWLLVPLFLLPLAAGAGFCLDARQRYLAEIAPFFADGARAAAAWLEAEPPGDLGLANAFAPDPTAVGTDRVTFIFPGGEGEVLLGRHGLGKGPWLLAGEYPAGLSVTSLADPRVRVEVETGTAPFAAAPVDAGTEALAALADAPDLEALRTAPLPAMSKLFLVRRWSDAGAGAFGEAERLLGALADFQRVVMVHGLPATPGEHAVGNVRLIVPGPGRPVVLVPEGVEPGFLWSHRIPGADRFPAVLSVSIPAGRVSARHPVAWRGRLEEPVAGEWTIGLPYGHDWWRAPRFTRWAGPVLGGVLLFLTLPTALGFSIRRRRKLDEARARFITELAHDLRTPLTSLRLYAEMLAEGKAPEGRRTHYAEVTAREAARVSGLLANLLDLSRLERGRRDLKPERLDLDEALEPAIHDFTMLYPERADDLKVAGEDGIAAVADRTVLTRCVLNLLDNAGKFTAEGTAIELGFRKLGAGFVAIRVSDEGPGIQAGERGRLFRRYERGSRARKDGVPGTGLGLSIVAELAEGMGGKARCVAVPRGAVFEIVLPGGAS